MAPNASKLGLFCLDINITPERLLSGDLPKLASVTNGVVIELCVFVRTKKMCNNPVGDWLQAMGIEHSEMNTCVWNLYEHRQTLLRSKKAIEVTELLKNCFDPNKWCPAEQSPLDTAFVEVEDKQAVVKDLAKEANFLQYEITKNSAVLQNITQQKENFRKRKQEEGEQFDKELSQRKGHYAPRNMDRREKRAKDTLESVKEDRDRLEQEVLALRQSSQELTTANQALLAQQQIKETIIVDLKKEKHNLQKQRSNAALRPKDCKDCISKSNSIYVLERELEKFHHDSAPKKKVDLVVNNRIPEDVKMTIIELIPKDVATGQICSVIEVVARNIFDTDCSVHPSRTAVQNIADTGQVLAKTFIAEKAEESESVGFKKDGTNKRNTKILTSVLALDRHEFTTGFTAVASETGEAIKDDIAERLSELGSVLNNEDFKVDTLKKLVFLMNDRASNEKKSNRLIKEWVTATLASSNEQPHTIQEYFCMAHVLLAFHAYSLKEIKKLNDIGLLLCYTEYKNPIERFMKYAADMFAPVGDHRGLKNVWLEDCRQRGVSGEVSNYKDNRFNGLFSVACQIFHHHPDMIRVLEDHKNFNARQKYVLGLLSNSSFLLLLKVLGIFYCKITKPYWNIVTGGKYSYWSLKPVVRELAVVLKDWVKTPAKIFVTSVSHFHEQQDGYEQTVMTLPDGDNSTLLSIIQAVALGVSTAIEAQCPDLLNDGDDQPPPMPVFASSTATNLSVERVFGVLDSSMNRRPNASLHHHTTVVNLKETCKVGMPSWFKAKPRAFTSSFWKRSGSQARKLRRQHRASDQLCMTEVHKMSQSKGVKAREAAAKRVPSLPCAAEPLSKDTWVVVAYPSNWYTGKQIINVLFKCSRYRKLG